MSWLPHRTTGTQRHHGLTMRQVRLLSIPNYAQESIRIIKFCVCLFPCVCTTSGSQYAHSVEHTRAVLFSTSLAVDVHFAIHETVVLCYLPTPIIPIIISREGIKQAIETPKISSQLHPQSTNK